MKNDKLDLIYNKKYLVIVPQMSEVYLDAFKYTFKNVIFMKNDIDSVNYVTNYINNSNFTQLIFVDYQTEFERIFLNLNKKHEIKYIFTYSLGMLSNEFIYTVFHHIYDNYKKGKISSIGFIDKGIYETFKNKGDNVSLIKLDVENKKQNDNINENTIGLLNSEHVDTHGFYNELSAIKLTNKYEARIPKCNKKTSEFVKEFNITIHEEKNVDEIIGKNIINLDINFTNTNPTLFLRSMDLGIPCILGNTSIIDDYKVLKENLILNSDDNVNEIKDKILKSIKNIDKIKKEYNKFREEYTKDTKVLAENFLGVELDTEKESKDYEYLISVIVPVYNTEKYLRNSLNSIIEASVDNMEILVINDGSKDNSEEIIKEFEKEYPKLIRYIKQENHGLGNVRNVGLREAKGKYIASIDSDDTINVNFFTSALKYLEEDVDVVMCDWLSITDETKFETAALDWVFNNRNKYEGLLYTSIMPSTCNKIMKKSLFDELDLTYLEDKYEDLSTNPFILLKAQTIKYINKPYYEYYIRSNSIMRSSAGFSMIDVIKFVDNRVKKYNDLFNIDVEEFKHYTYSWRIEEFVMNQLYTLEEKELEEFINYTYKNIKDIMLDIFKYKRYQDMVNELNEEDKNFITDRNKAFESGKLLQFIKKARKEDKYYKLTPGVIYYGNK